jgi:hypothetical protein
VALDHRLGIGESLLQSGLHNRAGHRQRRHTAFAPQTQVPMGLTQGFLKRFQEGLVAFQPGQGGPIAEIPAFCSPQCRHPSLQH